MLKSRTCFVKLKFSQNKVIKVLKVYTYEYIKYVNVNHVDRLF